MDHDIAAIRKDYSMKVLTRDSVDENPLAQFRKWLNEAITSKVNEPTAMTLATAGSDGIPSARIVLLKDADGTGLSFFTNYESKKGRQLQNNSSAALVFFWPELERQVRFEGNVKKLSGKESDSYFISRPTGSKLGAWASRQSNTITSRLFLENEVQKYSNRFKGQSIPRPSFWGGYLLTPNLAEFWQGRPDRLHDRIHYKRIYNKWDISRLSP